MCLELFDIGVDVCRAIVTSDGQSQGYKSLSHSMGTKSKLIYKWRPANNQSTPSSLLYEDLYGGEFNEEEFSETLETLIQELQNNCFGNYCTRA